MLLKRGGSVRAQAELGRVGTNNNCTDTVQTYDVFKLCFSTVAGRTSERWFKLKALMKVLRFNFFDVFLVLV